VIAAFNSFQAYQRGQLGKVKRFATIGTGSGTDMIAALETFPDLEFGAMTDLHQSVVSAAKRNVLGATEPPASSRTVAKGIYASAGDLLLPLAGQEAFDLIYEHVPGE
jgi:methylase of polypeptide subunit release factors